MSSVSGIFSHIHILLYLVLKDRERKEEDREKKQKKKKERKGWEKRGGEGRENIESTHFSHFIDKKKLRQREVKCLILWLVIQVMKRLFFPCFTFPSFGVHEPFALASLQLHFSQFPTTTLGIRVEGIPLSLTLA